MGCKLSTVTIDILKEALRNSIARKLNWEEDEIKEIAEMVISFFGFEDAMIDNLLKPKDRDIFYKLENEGILKTFEEEVQIQKGKLWRIHYWMLNKPRIFKLAEGPDKEEKQKQREECAVESAERGPPTRAASTELLSAHRRPLVTHQASRTTHYPSQRQHVVALPRLGDEEADDGP